MEGKVGREERRERVARAICKSRTCEGSACCQWPAQGGRTKCPVNAGGYDDAADAAIATIDALMVEEGMVVVPREPTEAMRDAGTDAAPESGEDDSGCDYFYGSEVALDVYRAMIGAFERAK